MQLCKRSAESGLFSLRICIALVVFGVVALFAVASPHLLSGKTRRVANPAHQDRTTEEENLTPPAGLKPVEQEAWLAIARRRESTCA